MIKVWRWLKRWWWTIVVGFASVAGFLFFLLVPRSKRITRPEIRIQKTFKEKAQERVDRVRLEGEVEKARVKATAKAQNQQLDDIEIIGQDEPDKARRQLAFWLSRNL